MKISIITATFNSEKTLADTIESVLNQTYPDIEYIVIDGVSTDRTVALARSYESRFGGRMRIVSEPDRGIYDALNKGIALATGEVIGFIHADDMLYDNEVIAKINATFVEQKCELIYGDLVMVNSANSKTVRNWKSQPFSRRLLRKGWMAAHPTLYASRHAYQSLGTYDLAYPICADYDWIVRACTQIPSQKITYLPQYIVRMRVGGTSAQRRNFWAMLSENWNIIKAHKIGGVGTLLLKKFSKLIQFIDK